MSLWQAISKKQYNEALNLIKKNSALVNAVNDDKNSVLMEVLNHHSKPGALELIKYIMAQPTFNIAYKNPDSDETTIDAVIATASLDILKLAEGKVEGFLTNGDQLTYFTLFVRLTNTQRMYNREVESGNKNAPRTKTRLDGYQSMVDHMKQATLGSDALILHAISIDSVNILEQLVKLEKDPLANLKNGTDPSTLLTERTPKLKAWFEQKKFEKAIAEMSSSQQEHTPGARRNAVVEEQQLTTSIRALKASHLKKQSKVMQEAIEQRTDTLAKAVTPSTH